MTLRRFMNTSRGFTLIELLVVIAIIGILSSVVLASLSSARAKGNYAAVISEMHQLETAAYLAYDSGGGWPTDVGPGSMPPNFGISKWPTPPCTNMTYDWENWGGYTIRITLRRTNGSSVYYHCIYTSQAAPGCNYGDGVPIQDVTTKQVTCSE